MGYETIFSVIEGESVFNSFFDFSFLYVLLLLFLLLLLLLKLTSFLFFFTCFQSPNWLDSSGGSTTR